MKKRLCIISLLLLIILMTIPFTVSANSHATVNGAEVNVGDKIVYTLSIDEADRVAMGIQLDIVFDDDILQVVNAECLNLSSYVINPNKNNNGKILLNASSLNGLDFTDGNDVLKAEFKVIKKGNAKITENFACFYDIDYEDVVFEYSHVLTKNNKILVEKELETTPPTTVAPSTLVPTTRPTTTISPTTIKPTTVPTTVKITEPPTTQVTETTIVTDPIETTTFVDEITTSSFVTTVPDTTESSSTATTNITSAIVTDPVENTTETIITTETTTQITEVFTTSEASIPTTFITENTTYTTEFTPDSSTVETTISCVSDTSTEENTYESTEATTVEIDVVKTGDKGPMIITWIVLGLYVCFVIVITKEFAF